jgi:hypothetical protein
MWDQINIQKKAISGDRKLSLTRMVIDEILRGNYSETNGL